MDSLFAKLILSLASILGLVSSPVYVELGAANLTFNYKTGQDPQVIHYLAVKNIGPQKARFVASADVPWIFISREGTDFTKSVDLEANTETNFVLTIQTRDVADGSHQAEVTVEARTPDIFSNPYDFKKVAVTLNKNFVALTPAPAITPESALAATAPPTSSLSPIPTPSVILATPPSRVLPKPTKSFSPKPILIPSTSPAPSVSPSPGRVPAVTLRFPSPFPTLKILPEEVVPQAGANRNILENIWSFLRNLFF